MAKSPLSVLTSLSAQQSKAAKIQQRNDILKTDQVRIKSVSTSIGQTTKLEHVNGQLISGLKDIYTYRDSLLKSNRLLWYIIELQIHGCLRISEVLEIKPSDIMANGQVLIKSKKGSNHKVVSVSDGSRYLISCRHNSVYPFQGISRQYVGREYIKLGISIPNVLGVKNATTHAIRHLVISDMAANGFDQEAQLIVSGHKRVSNLQYYDHTKKQPSSH